MDSRYPPKRPKRLRTRHGSLRRRAHPQGTPSNRRRRVGKTSSGAGTGADGPEQTARKLDVLHHCNHRREAEIMRQMERSLRLRYNKTKKTPEQNRFLHEGYAYETGCDGPGVNV